jgi:hypothetical protein
LQFGIPQAIKALFFKSWRMNLSEIQPLIVPASYLDSGFDWPHEKLGTEELIVCWVRFTSQALPYILREEVEALDLHDKDWRRIGLDNLRHAMHFHQFIRRNTEGKIQWIAFMNEEDVLSSSKILLAPELSGIFPEGYKVSTPNRAVAFAVSAECDTIHYMEVMDHTYQMFKENGSPNSRRIYEAAEFQLPEDLLSPIDPAITGIIVAHVHDITNEN